jgi:hypothetical protein
MIRVAPPFLKPASWVGVEIIALIIIWRILL